MNSYLALKAAVRDLVKAAGGNVRAATVSRADGARLSRYGAIQENAHAPIDVIADLEQDVGDPIVTRLLADMAGYVLVPKEKAAQSVNFTRHLSEIARETSDVIGGLGDAIGDDAAVNPREAERLITDVRSAQETFANLEDDLRRIAANESKAA